MEPEQYAKFLVDSFYLTTKGIVDSHIDAKKIAKQSALIAAKEMLQSQPPNCHECGGGNKDYYKSVKEEIEKH